MMQVQCLDRSAAAGRSFDAAIGSLIENVGRPTFPFKLFAAARELASVEHLTAFESAQNEAPQIIFARNTGETLEAETVGKRYIEEYWRHDPAVNAFTRQCPNWSNSRFFAVKTSRADIDHLRYRSECYTSVRLDHRLSLLETRNGRMVRVNFYRLGGDGFDDGDATRLMDAARILMPLVRRHSDSTKRTSTTDLADVLSDRLSIVAPTLTTREREVCALIALGVTSEGIALRLEISVNSVLTYRKRAYVRLQISSQNELMRMIMV